jgi:LemA protein
MKNVFVSFLFFVCFVLLSGCGLQSIPRTFNEVDASWAEVQNQYQRRADLIPNLVNTVKGFAAQEKDVLVGVTEARAKATQMQVDASNLTPEKLKAFQSAQDGLSQALGKLMVVSERYPELKSNENFLSLQAQLEGTENRITIARRRYIDTVKEFNNLVTVFPTSLTNSVLFKHEKKPQFETPQANATPPQVQF